MGSLASHPLELPFLGLLLPLRFGNFSLKATVLGDDLSHGRFGKALENTAPDARNGTSTWMHLSVAVIVTQRVREEELQKNFCLKVSALLEASSTKAFEPPTTPLHGLVL